MKRWLFVCCFVLLGVLVYAQQPAFVLPLKDIIPEGITYDSVKKEFYISSIHKNKIIRFANNRYTDFIGAGQDGFTGGLGMQIDYQRRILWACTGDIDGKFFNTGVYAFDLKTGKLLNKISYPRDTVPTLFNDLLVMDNGDVYITNTFQHSIWLWKSGAGKPEQLHLRGGTRYPNGITASPDKKILFIATSQGIKRLVPGTDSVSLLVSSDSVPANGVDGLVYYKNSLIGIQNIAPDKKQHAVVRYYLSQDATNITRTLIIDRGNRYFNIPTTAVLAGKSLFVLANSQLDALTEGKKLKPGYPFDVTTVLRYDLE